MGMRTPETCWAVFKWQVINLRIWCIWLVDSVERVWLYGPSREPPPCCSGQCGQMSVSIKTRNISSTWRLLAYHRQCSMKDTTTELLCRNHAPGHVPSLLSYSPVDVKQIVSPKTSKTTWLRGIEPKLKLSPLIPIPFRFVLVLVRIQFLSFL